MKRVTTLKEGGYSADVVIVFGGKVKDDCRENRILPDVVGEILKDNASAILSHKSGERFSVKGFGMTVQGRVEAYEDVIEVSVLAVA